MQSKANSRVEAIFQDSEALFQEGLRKLDAGDLRHAAELAAEATLRAAAAFVMARTGEEGSDQVAFRLRELAVGDPQIRQKLADHYVTVCAAMYLLTSSTVEPGDDYIRIIQKTADYIKEARKLAGRH